jgi:hypothetical protein
MSNSPYFSLAGMAFQTPGSEAEGRINVCRAMSIIKAYVTGRESQEDVPLALEFLASQSPKLEPFIKDIQATFLLDDFLDAEIKRAIGIRAYNGIADRLSGRAVRGGGPIGGCRNP